MNYRKTGEFLKGRIETKPVDIVIGGMPVYYTGCPSKVKVWEVLETPMDADSSIDIMPYPTSPRSQCTHKKKLSEIVFVYETDRVSIVGVNGDHETGKSYIKTHTSLLVLIDQWKKVIKAGMVNTGMEVMGEIVFDEEAEDYAIEIKEESFQQPSDHDLFVESLEKFRKDINDQINNKIDEIRDRFKKANTSNQRTV